MDRRVYLLAALFVLALMPVVGTYLYHHPDERHFPDGAMRMLETGDFITPYTGNGELRLRKPILGYWVQAGSYAILGVSPLSTRLPYLLQGAAIVILTAVLARQATKSRRTALVAGAVAACQLQLIYTSTLSTSDITLTMFILISAIGFTAMRLRCDAGGRLPRWAPWCAYVGAGLGAATKGLLPGVFFAVVIAWWVIDGYLNRRAVTSTTDGRASKAPRLDVHPQALQRPGAIASLLHLPAMLTGLVVAGAWYLAVFLLHRQHLIDEFIGDQLTGKIRPNLIDPLRRIPGTLIAMIGGFLPILLLLPTVWVCRHRLTRPIRPAMRRFRRLALLWAAVSVVLFGFADRLTFRYEAPALPLLAVVLADWLARLDYAAVTKALRAGLTVLCALLLGAALLSGLIREQLVDIGDGALVLAIGVAIAIALAALARRASQSSLACAFASAVVVLIGYGFAGVSPALGPEQSREIVAMLDRLGVDRDKPVLYLGKPAAASKLRVRGGGTLTVVQKQGGTPLAPSAVVVVDLNDAPRIDLRGWTVHEVKAGLSGATPGGLYQAMRDRTLLEYLAARRETYLVAVPAARAEE